MRKWFFAEIESFTPTLGFSTAFAFEYQGKMFTHQWDIRAIKKNKKLVLGWKYKEYKGEAIAEFLLEPHAYGTQLFFSTQLLKPFPALKEFSPSSMETGWTELLKGRLTTYCKNLKGN